MNETLRLIEYLQCAPDHGFCGCPEYPQYADCEDCIYDSAGEYAEDVLSTLKGGE